MLIPVADTTELNHLQALPTAAIDLGFSGAQRSCGFASRKPGSGSIATKNFRFQECMRNAAEYLGPHDEAVLIIEAPLSAAFDAAGNPQARGLFESSPSPRWWSFGAGATMALAAQYFLRDFTQRVPVGGRVHLIEGFVAGADSGNHADVAGVLLGAFLGNQAATWIQPTGHALTSIVDWIEPGAPRPIPIVLMPKHL